MTIHRVLVLQSYSKVPVGRGFDVMSYEPAANRTSHAPVTYLHASVSWREVATQQSNQEKAQRIDHPRNSTLGGHQGPNPRGTAIRGFRNEFRHSPENHADIQGAGLRRQSGS